MIKNYKPKICKICGKEFIPRVGTQIYCGSKTNKIGCSFQEQKNKVKRYLKSDKGKKWMNEYQKKRQKEHRKKNTDYAQRVRRRKREYARSPQGKKVVRQWRKKNIHKILEYNRKRTLKKRDVKGTHTNKEWLELKEKFNNECVICGTNEESLKMKYKKPFDKLTRDHIIPLDKNGTDNIDNIQPLCVGCNAKKQNRILKDKVVIISGHWDPIHEGHINLFKEAAFLGDELYVIVNNNKQTIMKKGYCFMDDSSRLVIAGSVKYVTKIFLSIDEDSTVCETLRKISDSVKGKKLIFANGGDRKEGNVPEQAVCDELNIKMVYGVGGEKTQSSSELIKQSKERGD